MHADEWFFDKIDLSYDDQPYHTGNVNYAKWMFQHFRRPAIHKMAFDEFMKDRKLFCTFEGNRFRVTGASRLGDVWLATDFNQETGYNKRVDLKQCSEWSDKP